MHVVQVYIGYDLVFKNIMLKDELINFEGKNKYEIFSAPDTEGIRINNMFGKIEKKRGTYGRDWERNMEKGGEWGYT